MESVITPAPVAVCPDCLTDSTVPDTAVIDGVRCAKCLWHGQTADLTVITPQDVM